MKFVKILTSAVLLAALAVSMIACGGEEAATTTTAAATTAKAAQTTVKKDETTAAPITTAAPVTTAAPDTTGVIDIDAWNGFWSYDQSTGHYIMDNKGDGNDFGVLQIPGSGAVEEGKTKYTVSVTTTYNTNKEKCFMFGVSDDDGDGLIAETADTYLMCFFNNGAFAYATNHQKWDSTWTPASDVAYPKAGTVIKATIVLDTAANTVTMTTADAETGDVYGTATWTVDLAGAGVYFALGAKGNSEEFWGFEYSAE